MVELPAEIMTPIIITLLYCIGTIPASIYFNLKLGTEPHNEREAKLAHLAIFWPITTPLYWLGLINMGCHLKPESCTTCGYNLTGNVSGICPECGTKNSTHYI